MKIECQFFKWHQLQPEGDAEREAEAEPEGEAERPPLVMTGNDGICSGTVLQGKLDASKSELLDILLREERNVVPLFAIRVVDEYGHKS